MTILDNDISIIVTKPMNVLSIINKNAFIIYGYKYK